MLLNPGEVWMRLSGVMGNRILVSDEVWSVIGPLFPVWKGNGRPVADRRLVVEGDGMDVPDRGALAGPSRALRELEHRVQKLRPLGQGRHLD